MKKRLAFLLGITPNLAFAAGNVALGINKYMTDQEYDIVIYYTDLADHDIEAFQKIPHVVLKQFNLPEDFITQMLEKMPEGRFKSRNHLNCFAHFEVFPLLETYKNVVWIDADTCIQGDLSDITALGPFGVSPDTPWSVGDQFSVPVNGYNMKKEGYCTAVMMVNDTLPYQKIYPWLYEKAVQYADRLVNPDQAILALAIEAFNIEPTLIDVNVWQCLPYKESAPTAKIVHFGTGRKVWNDAHLTASFPEWYRNHLMWLSLGGSDFSHQAIQCKNAFNLLKEFDRLKARQNVPFKSKKYYLFGFLPLFKIKQKYYKSHYFLFSHLPILKIKRK